MRARVTVPARTDATWVVATAIHRRCCTHTACAGPFVHLQEAAAATEALLGPPGPEEHHTGGQAAA
ncbi:MAG TPA: hypothetical protein VMU63_00820 [Acidimicrobiales bacterium]|nr:hypothetical protein [Acidimicrobiales bacterium]